MSAGRRLRVLSGHLSLQITDNRSGKDYYVPIRPSNSIHVSDLCAITLENGIGLRSYDPGFANTISCGTLEFRGYSIQDLAKNGTYLEVTFLLLNGVLPTAKQLGAWEANVFAQMQLPTSLARLIKSFRYDAPPMGILVSALTALSTLEPLKDIPDEEVAKDPKKINELVFRVMGAIPVIAAAAIRHKSGRVVRLPRADLGYIGSFLWMLDDYPPSLLHLFTSTLETMFILQAEHEVNCSTSAVRLSAYAQVNVYSAVAVGASALYGRRHGGANEAAVRMMEKIGTKSQVDEFLAKVRRGETRLMGFGHRVYKTKDPRAEIAKSLLARLMQAVGGDPLVEIAEELEKQALADSYFRSRRLYPNIDFYSGLIYRLMGFSSDMFAVLFSMALSAGWLSHWKEFIASDTHEQYAPCQHYIGKREQAWVPMSARHHSKSPKRTQQNRPKRKALGYTSQ